MRIVGGSARGRKLTAPAGLNTRPTSDRVREAIFSMLASRDAVVGARVADLFAGSGAMGIEALSRGAAHVTFVERDRAAVRVIEANLAATGLAEHASVTGGDASLFSGPVDLAIVDPPYEFDGWDDLLARLQASLAVLESDRELDVGRAWEVVKAKRYGSTVVTLSARREQGEV